MPWTGIAAAGVSALASAGSSFAASKMNHKSFKRNMEMMKLQSKLNQRQYAWQMDKYLSPLAQRRLFENAGMNINEITRSGQSMMNAGQLGGVSNPGAGQSFAPDFSGLAQAGGHIAQSVVRAQDAKLKKEQAITEQKVQFLHSKQSELYEAYKDNTVVKTALDSVNLAIANATKDNKIKMSDKEYETMCENLTLIGTQIAQSKWQLNFMNPLLEIEKQASYCGMLAAAALATANTRVSTAQVDYVIQATKTQVTQQLLNMASENERWQAARESVFRQSVHSWDAVAKEQLANKYRNESEEARARAAKTWREYDWMPAMNSAKLVEVGLDVFGTVLFKGMGKGVMGETLKSKKALQDSQKRLNETLQKQHSQTGKTREYFDKNGEFSGGYTEEIVW